MHVTRGPGWCADEAGEVVRKEAIFLETAGDGVRLGGGQQIGGMGIANDLGKPQAIAFDEDTSLWGRLASGLGTFPQVSLSGLQPECDSCGDERRGKG